MQIICKHYRTKTLYGVEKNTEEKNCGIEVFFGLKWRKYIVKETNNAMCTHFAPDEAIKRYNGKRDSRVISFENRNWFYLKRTTFIVFFRRTFKSIEIEFSKSFIFNKKCVLLCQNHSSLIPQNVTLTIQKWSA